jgi:zinc protease
MTDAITKTLESGLRAVVLAVPGAPVAAVQVWIGSGGADERAGEEGLAHLHEHMLFKGTPTRGVGEVAATIEGVGGQINAWTSNDHTCYHAIVPGEFWQQGLAVLADAVCHPLFDAGELAREIEVVVEEIRRAGDSPGQVAFQRLTELAFADHPYALPVLGTAESVRGMTSERMRAFWRKHYVAANTTVVVAGDVDPAEATAAIAAQFADQPRGPLPDRAGPTATTVPSRADVLVNGFSESRVLLGWPLPPLDHADVPALDVLALVLGQGDSSRLVRSVQREKGLVNDLGASSWTPVRGGVFTLTALTNLDRLVAACDAMLEVLADLRAHGITDAELGKAKANLLADATYKLETAQGQAHALGYFAVATGDPHWDRVYEQRVRAVTASDVQDVARRYLGVASLCAVELPGEGLPTEEACAARAADILQRAQERLAVAAPWAARVPDVVDGIERMELPSGDVLVVRPDRSVPLFGLRVAALGGVRDEDAGTCGRGHLLAQMLTRGTERRSAHEIAVEIETLAAGLGGSAGRNSLGLQAVGLSAVRDAVVDLFCDTLFSSILPDADLEQERAVQLEDIRHDADQPARQALRAVARLLYGAHPYGLDQLGSESSVSSLDRAALLDHLRGRLCPGRLVYGAAGDVDPQTLADALSARTPPGRHALPPPCPAPPPPLRERVQARPIAQKQQAHVAIGFRAAKLDEPERFALDVLATVLGGQSGRLFLELRDKQSLAYSVSAMHEPGVDEGWFALYMGTAPDKVPQALAGLWGEIDRIRQAAPGADELDRARNAFSGGHAVTLQRRSSRAAALCLNELYGLGRAAWSGHVAALRAVTKDDVLAVAQRYLTPEASVEVVLAPAS